MPVTASEPHTIVQSWVGVSVLEKLRAHAKAEGCSVSSLVRDALEDYSFADASGEGRATGGSLPLSPAKAPAREESA